MGKTKRHNLTYLQHKEWIRTMLAPDLEFPQYPGNENRGRGRWYGLCHCMHCDWCGFKTELLNPGSYRSPSSRRPDGRCPKCKERPYWAELTKAQANVLAP